MPRQFTTEIDGHVYTFEMTIEAMETLEALFSTPQQEVTFLDIARRVSRGSARHFKRFIWASLLAHQPDTTLEDAARLINEAGGMLAMDGLLGQLATEASPDPKDLTALGVKPEKNPPKAQARTKGGTGQSSIARPAASA